LQKDTSESEPRSSLGAGDVWSRYATTYRHLVTLKEFLLLGLLCLLLTGEVIVVKLVNVDTSKINGGRGGDHVAGVDTAKRNTVNLERTGDEQDTVGQSLQEHNALAPETTSEEDQDGTGLEGRAEGGRPDGLADLS